MRLEILSSRLYRQICLLPAFPSPGQGSSPLPSGLPEFLRHPGACALMVSGTVGDNPCLWIQAQLPGPVRNVIGRHPNGSSGLSIASLQAALGAHIKNHNLLL